LKGILSRCLPADARVRAGHLLQLVMRGVEPLWLPVPVQEVACSEEASSCVLTKASGGRPETR
jgi:hypothetical protein